MRTTADPDCKAITTARLNVEKCLSALPGCCEEMFPSEDADPPVTKENAVLYAKCPELEEIEAKCDGKDGLSAPPRTTPGSTSAAAAAKLQGPIMYAAIAFGVVLFI